MSSVSVVVVTCDKYSKLLPGFYYFLNRHWPDRPWPLQIVTGSLPQSAPYPCHYYGEDRGWASNMLHFLPTSPEIIVLLLDDYYLSANADDNAMRQLVNMMEADESIGYINLRPWGDDVLGGRDFVSWQQIHPRPLVDEYDKVSAEYLLSLQPGIWRTAFLRGLLRAGEDHWRTETRGTIRARESSLRMLGCLWSFIPYVNITRYGIYRDGSREWLVGELGATHTLIHSLDGMVA